ncbi:MAG: AraC family transcriptional regulator [Eubacterium sp.]|nr:AraC family transcriptional regulator [Eubacterium sp.]
MSVLDQYIRMLHYAITGNTLDMDMIITQYTESTGKESREQERSFTDYERERNREQTMLQCIREGNRNYHQILDDAVRMSRYSLGLDTPLREAKDIVIIFAATCTRAAVEGGISNKSGREMEIRYLHEIEACSRVTDLAVLRRRIMDECVEAVCEVIQESTVSRPIQACCDYVKAHFNEPIDLKDIAKSVGYTEYYLTKRFQKEVGIKLLDYIKKVRLSYAKVWLLTNEKSIQEISEILQFSTRNYFTKVFKAQEGITPAEYRERAMTAGTGTKEN